MAKNKNIRFIIEYILLIIIAGTIRILPLWVKYGIGNGIGLIAWIFDSRHRTVALNNLAHVFPEKTIKERKRIARRSFYNLGKTFMEFLHLPRMNHRFVMQRFHFRGEHNVRNALKKGKGVIAVTSHLDNWELLGTLVQNFGYQVRAVYHSMRNPLSDHYINTIRLKTGMELLSMKASPGTFIRSLLDNTVFGLIADQDAGKHGVFIDFLNRKASAWRGPAMMALRTGAPLIIFTLIRLPGNRHAMHASEPIDCTPTEDTHADIIRITQQWNNIIADYIRRYPEQYYWVHQRWRTQPKETS